MRAKYLLNKPLNENDNIIVLNTEEEAWRCLEDLLDGKNIPDNIALGEWAKLKVKFTGRQYNQTLTPDVFPIYSQLETDIRQIYAKIKYGQHNKRLKISEKENLQLIVKVEKGSSETFSDIDLSPLLTEMVGKLESQQIFIIGLVLVLGYFGNVAFEKFLKYRIDSLREKTKSKDQHAALEQIRDILQVDERKTKLFTDAIKSTQHGPHIAKQLEDHQDGILRVATKVNQSEINGVTLDNIDAEALTRGARAKAKEETIQISCIVIKINWEKDNPFVTLKNTEDDKEITAVLDTTEISNNNLNIIRDAEWKRHPIDAMLNIRKTSHGKIVSAEIISANIPTN